MQRREERRWDPAAQRALLLARLLVCKVRAHCEAAAAAAQKKKDVQLLTLAAHALRLLHAPRLVSCKSAKDPAQPRKNETPMIHPTFTI